MPAEPDPRAPTTLKGIARRAGVSHVTVSNVLNGRAKPRRADAIERAERIRAIAEEMGYRPDPAAVSLRNRRTSMIAVLGEAPLVTPEANFEEREILHALAVRLNDELGYHLTADLGWRKGRAFTLPPWKVDAALVIGVASAEDLDPVRASGVPFVSINAEHEPGDRGGALLFDDAGAVGVAVDRLVGLGHRGIAFLNGHAGFRHRSTGEREAGYLAALRRHGLDVLPGHGQGDEAPDAAFLHRLRGLGCTAILTYEPDGALAVCRAAEELGLALPDDLSLITFNQTHFGSRVLRPPLTCLARPAQPVADAAFALFKRLLSPDPPGADAGDRIVRVRQELIETASIGPAPNGALRPA